MKLKLSYRINLYIGCIIFLGMGIMGYHHVIFYSRFFENAGIEEAKRLSEAVFDNLYAAMKLGGESIDNRDTIERLKKIEGIKDIRIIHGPQIDAQFGVEEDESPVDKLEMAAVRGSSEVEVDNGEEWAVRFVMPVFIKEECTGCHRAGVGDVAGAVSVTISLEHYRGFIRVNKKLFFSIAGGMFLLTTAAIIFTVRGRLLSPLEKLRKGAEAIERGDLGYRVEILSGDEMEEVGKAFDSMAGRLNETIIEFKNLNEKHSKLLSMAVDAIIVHDAQTGEITDVNLAAEFLTGYTRPEFMAMKIDDMYPPEELKEYYILRKKWVQDGRGYFHETCIKRKDSVLVPVETAASVVEFGGRIYLQEIWRDLTERKGFAQALKKYTQELEGKVEERTAALERSFSDMERYKNELEDAYGKLKESQKTLVETAKMASLGELGAGIAHELNSPLAGILAITELLMRRGGKASENYQLLEKIKDAGLRSKNIISDLLLYAMPSRLEISPLCVDDTIKSTLSLFISELKIKSMEIKEEFPQGLPRVYGNKGQLMEVFLNIIKNARDAMKGSGTLTIRTSLAKEIGKDYVLVEIEDTGEGIPDEIKDKIFDPFFTTKEKGGGLNIGLGLSITKSIVKAHKGKIDFTSTSGKGTVFRVFLPALKEDETEGR